jgi:cytochrome c-type biogenesis protein CcmE
MKMKAKTQRLYLVIGAMAALGGAGALAFSTLGDKATYFYAPSDLAGKAPPINAIRLGGMVQAGTTTRPCRSPIPASCPTCSAKGRA